jgi:diguanylate cyclase (GGDEF)-like protein
MLRDTYTASDGLPQSTVEALSRTQEGYLWLGTQDGLARFDGSRFKVFNRQNTDGLTQSHVRALSAANDGSLWIGTQSRGLVHFVNGRFIPYSVTDGLLSPFVRCALQDHQGEMWFCTLGGLAHWRNGKFDGFTTKQGLADNNVEAIAEDSQGRLWVGSASGICVLDHGRFLSFPDQKRFANQPVTSLAVDREGHVWVGGDQKLAEFAGLQIVTWFGPGGQSLPVSIDKLAIDNTGALWIGTGSNGLLRLRNGSLEGYGTSEGLSDADVLSLFADTDGNVWAGTNAGGLNRLCPRRVTMLGRPEGLSGRDALAVLEANDTSLWVATPGHGIDHVQNGMIHNYSFGNGLASNEVYCIWQSARSGTIWVGTKEGLLEWFDGRRFYRFALPDHGSILVVFEDRAGNLWLGTRRGLVQIRDGEVVRTYTKGGGLANSEVYVMDEGRDGSLWLGTMDGLSHFENGKFTNYSASSLGGTLVTSIHVDAEGVVWFSTAGDGLGRWENGKLSWATTRNGLPDDVLYAVVEDGAGNMWLSSNRGIIRIAKREFDDLAAGSTGSVTARAFDTSDGLRSNECYGGSQPTGWRRRNGDVLFACIGGVVMFNPAQLSAPSRRPSVSIEEARINNREVLNQASDGTVRIPPGTGSLEFTYTGIDFSAPHQMRFRYRLENFDNDWVDAGTRRSAYYTNISPGTYRFQVMALNADGVRSSATASLDFVLQPRFYQTDYFYTGVALLLVALSFAIVRLRSRRVQAHQRQLQRLVDERTCALQVEVAERKRAEIALQAARQAAEEARADAEYRAGHDYLSGILSRAAVIELLEREVSRCRRTDEPMSVLLIDIDHFKAINDTYGHLVGDQVIKLIASRIAGVLRSYDSFGRFGGEEFLIIAPNCNCPEAITIAERVRANVAMEPFLVGELSISSFISIGVSTLTGPANTAIWALHAADAALYEAKRNGRNRVVNYTSQDHAASSLSLLESG